MKTSEYWFFLPIIDTAIIQLREKFNSLYEVPKRLNFFLSFNI